MRTITNIYLGSLAVADLIYLSIGPLINFIAMQKSPVKGDRSSIIGSSFGCAMIRIPNWVAYYVSILLITAVTLEKYWAICKPMYYRGINNVLRTFKIVVGIWLSCILTGSLFGGIFWSKYQPACLDWPDEEDFKDLPTMVAFCRPLVAGGNIAIIAFRIMSAITFGIFVITLILNIFLYTLIIHQINEKITMENKQRSDPTDANVNLKRTRRKQQMVHMLLVNATVHFILLVPSQLINFLLATHLKNLISDEVRLKINWSAEVMMALNSSINPIIYILLNSQYRRSFYSAIMCYRRAQTEYMTARRPRSTKSTAVDD
ncbi:Neuropeptides capa receptor [Holothuria leucospilota]|uniref:Neuropeptides capa receptor n=1 Tax=Holothuria leucospilota TaxID=206669 RepID=A0A9Q1CD96_HOLLE|nr:Neuropeptides capa receptor [Holothuria leucospilota]